jgi:hypothetical protein
MRNFLRNGKIIGILYVLAALIIPLQRYLLGRYNNFEIFRHSSFHFFARTDLFVKYPGEYFDNFLYNPSFAFLFAPVAYLPTIVALYVWVGIVIAVYYFSIRLLPFSRDARLFIYLFTFLELVTSLENMQTNPLIAAFILFTFIFLERDKVLKAAAFPGMGFFIKGYGAISGILFILKRPKFKNFLYLLFWFLILLCLPLLYYSPAGFIDLYRQWIATLFSEHEINTGISLMGIIISITRSEIPIISIQIAGLFFFIATAIVIFFRKNYEEVKAIYLAYIHIYHCQYRCGNMVCKFFQVTD